MRKFVLFILFAGLTAFCGFSQSISLADSLGPIANNTTLVKPGTPDDIEIVTHIFVKNNSGAPLDIQCKKVELNMISGSINTFCWGACFGPSIFVTTTPVTVASAYTDSVNFSGHYTPMSLAGVSHMRYVFFDAANTHDSAWVNIDYSAFPLGIESHSKNAELSNAYPNPAGSSTSFTYSLPEGANGAIIFRNILGVNVKEVALNGSEGKISVSTDNLRDGIYFYSLQADGKSLQTRKLIVKH